jgi:Tol biopolymer transport system component
MKYRALTLVPLAAGLVVLAGPSPAGAAACSLQQLTSTVDDANNGAPRISHDGTVVLWSSDADLAFPSDNGDGSTELYRLDLDGNGIPEQVTDSTGSENLRGELSGDGDRVVFVSTGEHGAGADNGDGSSEAFLWEVGDDASDIQQLTNSQETTDYPTINGDGTRIAFASRGDLTGDNPDEDLEIFVHDTVAGVTTQLTDATSGGGGSYAPKIDDAGTRVVFVSDADLTGATPDGGQDVFRVDTTPETTTLLVDAPAQGASPEDVDADASVVAFDAEGLDLTGGNPDGSYEIYTHRSSSGVAQVTDLPDDDHYVNDARLDAAGDRLAFEANGDLTGENPGGEEYQLWVADRTGRVGIDQLTHGPMDVGELDMSHDGTRIVFDAAGDPVGENADGNDEIFLATCGGPHRTYTDVPPTNFFYEPIEWMAAAGVANGFPNGTFKPGDAVKRQQMANFLYNLAGRPEFLPSGQTFSDVPPSNPFFTPIEWMTEEGIANGFPNGTFRPNDPVKRQQMANFLFALAGSPAFDPGDPDFTDVPATNPFFTEIEWMAAEGIANGFPNGTFKPRDPVKRQQMANFLLNLVNGPGVDLD